MTKNCLDVSKMVEHGTSKTSNDIISGFPKILFEVFVQPMLNSVIKVNCFITPDFRLVRLFIQINLWLL